MTDVTGRVQTVWLKRHEEGCEDKAFLSMVMVCAVDVDDGVVVCVIRRKMIFILSSHHDYHRLQPA